MSNSEKSATLIKKLFRSEKFVCFGRYAIVVPQEANLIWGGASFPSRINFIDGGEDIVLRRVEEEIADLKWKDETAEIIYNGIGPIPHSRQIRYYEDHFSRDYNLYFFNTYVTKEGVSFVLGDSTRGDEGEEIVVARQERLAVSLRLRLPDEVPKESGYCIESGFIEDKKHADQEMISAGIFMPSVPDVTFSVSSNKDAYADYSPDDFEKIKRTELSLLARIKGAQEAQGAHYPKRTVLREGQRTVQHWHGEESLIRRADGTHDFEWGFVGTPRDVANPAEFQVQMFTKVAHNTVGAAEKASLSDEEAIALWDKLLGGLKFRVKVPGAPEGSYYFLPGAPAVVPTDASRP